MDDFLNLKPNPTSRHNNCTDNHGCYKGPAACVFYTVTLTVACIGLPFTVVAIFTISLMIRNGQVAPVYLVNLLISDFIQFCCLTVRAETKDTNICKISNYILEAGVAVSIYFMVVIALERYLVITCPLWYRFRRNIKTSMLVCVAAWVLPLLCLPFHFFQFVYVEIVVVCFLLLPFPLLLFFLGGTLKALSAARSVPDDEKRRILASLVLVLIFYTLLFMPRVIFLIANKSKDQWVFEVVTAIPVYLSPIVDLVLYVFMKKGIADTLLKFLCCCKINHDDASISKEMGDNTNTDISMQSQKEVGRKTDQDV